jgi:hypothetical protein
MGRTHHIYINKHPIGAKSAYKVAVASAIIFGVIYYILGLPVNHEFVWARQVMPSIFPWMEGSFITAFASAVVAFLFYKVRANTKAVLRIDSESVSITSAHGERQIDFKLVERIAFTKAQLRLKPYRIELKLKDREIVRFSMNDVMQFEEIAEDLIAVLPASVETFSAFMDSHEE